MDLLIRAKKLGCIEGEIPSPKTLKDHLSANSEEPSFDFEKLTDSVEMAKRVTSHPELVKPYHELTFSAIKLSLVKAPGKTSFVSILVSACLFVGFGLHSVSKLRNGNGKIFGASVLSKLPVRFC
tara:strand:- start:1869 stop:2243 length:375 start_codon:yes stop_codon:yes gene_type:complete